MTNRKRFFLSQDNSCDWYVIPEENISEWESWLEIDSSDEASWSIPNFARAIDGPSEQLFFLD